MTFGDVLYFVGFHVEYTAVRVGRGTAFWLRELARALVQLLAVVLRPPVRAAADFRAALIHPHRLVGLLLPLAAGALAEAEVPAEAEASSWALSSSIRVLTACRRAVTVS